MAGPVGIVIPHLVLVGASAAIEFYKKALGAVEIARHAADDGRRLMHAEIRLGASTIFLCDEFPEYSEGKSRNPKALGGVPLVLHQNVPNCDAAMKAATDAGARVVMPAADQFWGDRYGVIEDPFGYQWSFSHPLAR